MGSPSWPTSRRLGPLYQKLALQQLQSLAERRNIEMVQIFENSLHGPLAALLSDSVGRDARSLQATEDLARLSESALALMQDTSVFQVKVYNRLGDVIFSTDSRQIGQSRFDSPGFKTAIKGSVRSELLRRGTPSAAEPGAASADVLASFIPIRGSDQSVVGVFELHQNVMRIGVVACGYADGYPRHAPTGTPIAVLGRRTRTIGRVSMDMLACDITDIPEAGIGAPVTLWGDGLAGQVPADEVAAAAGTISYELFCALAPRVPVALGGAADGDIR